MGREGGFSNFPPDGGSREPLAELKIKGPRPHFWGWRWRRGVITLDFADSAAAAFAAAN